MYSRSFRGLSVIFLSTAALLAGCSTDVGSASSAGSEDGAATLGEALSSEDTQSDPIENATVTNDDANAAGEEASEMDPSENVGDVGCGFSRPAKQRFLDQFDTNGDGKIDDGEGQDVQDALDGHPRMKARLDKVGVHARPHFLKKLAWIYDANNDKQLDDQERAALRAALAKRCEVRKAHALELFDANDDGHLVGAELRAAVEARMAARRAKLVERLAQFDTDGDKKLSEDERAAMKQALVAKYEEIRAKVLAKYDADGSGVLEDSELSSLKADLRARFENELPSED